MIKRPRIYRRPDPTLATGLFREYRPRISCFHNWERNVVESDGIVALTILPGERCSICDATCVRDPEGRIVEYSTKAERELEEQERADREYVIAHPEMAAS